MSSGACAAAKCADKSFRFTRLWLLLRILLINVLLVASFDSAAASYSFGYDDADRLIQMVIGGNSVQYGYDAAGNLLSVQPHVSSDVTIAGFSPSSGMAGDTATILGSGFSSSVASNQVLINGTAATVTAASPNSLKVVIPAQATSGPISVTVAGVTATSSNPFNIAVLASPSVSSSSPTVATSGSTITINGANFLGSGTNLWVRVDDNYVPFTLVNANQITFTWPVGVSSGFISVGTQNGSANQTQLVLVPPTGLAANNIAATALLLPDNSATQLQLPAGKQALAGFAGRKGAGFLLLVTGDTLNDGTGLLDNNATQVSIVAPDGSVVTSRSIPGNSPRATEIQLPNLPLDGTYTVVVNPGSTDAGAIRVQLRTPGSGTSIPINGTATPISVAARDLGYYSVSGNPTQGISVVLSALNFTTSSNQGVDFYLQRPDGSYGNTYCPFTSGQLTCYIDASFFPMQGSYTLEVNPRIDNGVSFSAVITADATANLTVDAATPTTLTLQAWQRGRLNFSAIKGQGLLLLVTGDQLNNGQGLADGNVTSVVVYAPDGSQVTSRTIPSASPRATIIQLPNLPLSGNYTVMVNSNGNDYGSINLTLRSPGSGSTLPTSGASTAISVAARDLGFYSVLVTSGQSLAVIVNSASFTTSNSQGVDIYLQRPDGSYGNDYCAFPGTGRQSCVFASSDFAMAGRYTFEVNPRVDNGVTLSLSVSAEVQGVLVPNASATALTLTAPQDAKLTFSATQGQGLFLVVTDDTLNDGRGLSDTNTVLVSVMAPSGSVVTTRTIPGTSPRATVVQLPSLPSTGTYTVSVTPSNSDAGSISLQLITPGTSPLLPSNAPGVPISVKARSLGLYGISVAAGQPVQISVSGLTFTTSLNQGLDVYLQRPDGSYGNTYCSFTSGQTTCTLAGSSFPTSGVYTLEFNPRIDNGVSLLASTTGQSQPPQATTDNTDSADAPLPAWVYVLIGLGLLSIMGRAHRFGELGRQSNRRL